MIYIVYEETPESTATPSLEVLQDESIEGNETNENIDDTVQDSTLGDSSSVVQVDTVDYSPYLTQILDNQRMAGEMNVQAMQILANKAQVTNLIMCLLLCYIFVCQLFSSIRRR